MAVFEFDGSSLVKLRLIWTQLNNTCLLEQLLIIQQTKLIAPCELNYTKNCFPQPHSTGSSKRAETFKVEINWYSCCILRKMYTTLLRLGFVGDMHESTFPKTTLQVAFRSWNDNNYTVLGSLSSDPTYIWILVWFNCSAAKQSRVAHLLVDCASYDCRLQDKWDHPRTIHLFINHRREYELSHRWLLGLDWNKYIYTYFSRLGRGEPPSRTVGVASGGYWASTNCYPQHTAATANASTTTTGFLVENCGCER